MSALRLTYQLLWGRARRLQGVRLQLHDTGSEPGQALAELPALLHAVATRWPCGTALVLGSPSAALTAALLRELPAKSARLEWPDSLLQSDPTAQRSLLAARQRGLRLVWHGAPGQAPKPAQLALFDRCLMCPNPTQALHALHAARHPEDAQLRASALAWCAPGQWVEGVANRHLASHCLDQAGAGALLGWPAEDVLLSLRPTQRQPARSVVQDVLRTLAGEPSLDAVEQGMAQDPLLVWRFLRYVNSASVSVNRDVDALRPAIMVLGMSRLREWLRELLPLAQSDPNLAPVRASAVLRAQLMVALLQSGPAEALSRELLLCGLLSSLDNWLGEALPGALATVPLPERIRSALLQRSGAYWPYLQAALAMESTTPDPDHEPILQAPSLLCALVDALQAWQEQVEPALPLAA
jgi:hypothetical protein